MWVSLPWKKKSMFFEMSCLQSKSISASATGKHLLVCCRGAVSFQASFHIPLHNYYFFVQQAHHAQNLPFKSLHRVYFTKLSLFNVFDKECRVLQIIISQDCLLVLPKVQFTQQRIEPNKWSAEIKQNVLIFTVCLL